MATGPYNDHSESRDGTRDTTTSGSGACQPISAATLRGKNAAAQPTTMR